MSENGLTVEPVEAARAARLRYVDDTMPGIRRRRRGKGFSYVAPHGRPLRNEKELMRIRSLAIPPAWTDVWISPWADGHLQATGRDARGRKQYRYHSRWREVRDETKYARMVAFGDALPRIRRRVASDLESDGLPREKVLAAVARLLDETLIRVGNEEYVRDNDSFGVTTLRDRHVEIEGASIRFEFRGKGGKRHEVDLEDRRLARIIRRCRDIPGQELFQYLDDEGNRQVVRSDDLNDYLREIGGDDFTAKDFRTWAGTVLGAVALGAADACTSDAHGRRVIADAVKRVAERLGNTPAICRKCYINPEIFRGYQDGSLHHALDGRIHGRRSRTGLSAAERSVLEFLRQRLEV
ncbi:MAG: DNA topoisomerase IB [Gemmatimonadota bacterium]